MEFYIKLFWFSTPPNLRILKSIMLYFAKYSAILYLYIFPLETVD